ncbi:hypothetical protein Tco_1281877 [Tanacetum coccineum]
MGLNDLINWYQSHGALDLGSTSLGNMISMKNEGTAKVNEGTAEVNESTAEKIKVPLLFVKVPLVLSDILERTACFIRYRVLNAHIRYHLKELRYCAQCLIIENEDFVKRLCLGNMISMKNEGTAQVHEGTAQVNEGTAQVNEGTAQVNEGTAKVNEGTAEVNESTAEKIKVPLLFVKVPLVLSDILERTACFIRYRMRVLIIPFSRSCYDPSCISTEDPYWMITKRGRRLQGDDYISTSGEALAL